MPTYIPITDPEVAPGAPGTTSLFTRLRDNALSYLGAPAGTKLLFAQTAAPLGWTKDTVHNDKALRVVSGAAGSGGSSAFSVVFGKTATDGTTLSSANVPSMFGSSDVNTPTLSSRKYLSQATIKEGTGGNFVGVWLGDSTEPLVGSDPHTHAVSVNGSGGAHTHPMDLRVQYVDTIIAIKD